VKRLVFKKLNTEAVDDLKLTYHLTVADGLPGWLRYRVTCRVKWFSTHAMIPDFG
jgi:hypothetical protein